MSRIARRAWIAALLVAAAGALGMAALGLRGAGAPARCPSTMQPSGARCCAPGQNLQDDHCAGMPRSCPEGLVAIAHGNPTPGCVAQQHRVRIPPGRLVVGPGDWEAQGVVTPRTIEIPGEFWLDAHEVTVHAWNACVDAGACSPSISDEPGRPVRNVSFAQAQAFCRWSGGSLPTDDEWFFAAAGPQARRYPWGDTGAVCERTAWGMASGPCARGNGPDWAGIRPKDLTPEGVHDLGGSVAEWVVRADGRPAVRGGSWRSSFAAELRTWRVREQDGSTGADDVGIRCRFGQPGTIIPAVLPSSQP